ncbi:MAG: BrnT family toxin [Burkholderiaceae bacterium]
MSCERCSQTTSKNSFASCRPLSKTLVERGLDFEDAAIVFQGVTVEIPDERKEYGEVRIICFGLLKGRVVVIGYTPRGADRHIFSMRKANDREQTRLAPYLGL